MIHVQAATVILWMVGSLICGVLVGAGIAFAWVAKPRPRSRHSIVPARH